LAAVSVEDVRDVLHLSESDIPDIKVLKMIKRAEVTLELELSTDIDYQNCNEAQKEAITILAAIYAFCYLTGGSAIGLNFSVGDLRGIQIQNFWLRNHTLLIQTRLRVLNKPTQTAIG